MTSGLPQSTDIARLAQLVRLVPVASFRTAANSRHFQGGPAGQIKRASDETVSQQLWLLVIVCLLRRAEAPPLIFFLARLKMLTCPLGRMVSSKPKYTKLKRKRK